MSADWLALMAVSFATAPSVIAPQWDQIAAVGGVGLSPSPAVTARFSDARDSREDQLEISAPPESLF
jgi:hypothetical protein